MKACTCPLDLSLQWMFMLWAPLKLDGLDWKGYGKGGFSGWFPKFLILSVAYLAGDFVMGLPSM